MIDWAAVEEAIERSKRGRARDGDFDLVQRAYAADPERYKELHSSVVKRITEEMRRGW